MDYFDFSSITHITTADPDSKTGVREVKIGQRNSWYRIALGEIDRLLDLGAVPGAPAVDGYRTHAVARIRSGDRVDVTELLLAYGWSWWIENDRSENDRCEKGPFPIRTSTPDRDARIAAAKALEASPGEVDLQTAYDAACAAEDAAMARAAAGRDVAPVAIAPDEVPALVEVAEEVPASPSVYDDLRSRLDATLDRLSAQHDALGPVPANDALDHDAVLRRARAARDGAEATERKALGVFLAAQEDRRQAQADLDEILATAEVWVAPGVAEHEIDLHLKALTDDDYTEAARIGVLEYARGTGCEVAERVVEAA